MDYKPEVAMKIEKNIPIPGRYPFGQMEVGDSFAIPPSINRQTVSVAARRYSDKYNKTFVTRKMPDNTVRCWRTA
jgi:hypothetical protein